MPAGEVLWATPAELAQDRARRYPLLVTLDEERALKAEADRRWEAERSQPPALTADGRLWQYDEGTTRALLEEMQRRRYEALSFEQAWERSTGYAPVPEGL